VWVIRTEKSFGSKGIVVMILLTKMKSRKQGPLMRTKGLIQPLVGTEKIIIKDVFALTETNAIIIQARPPKREQCRCGICGHKAKCYDSPRRTRRCWCNDLGATYSNSIKDCDCSYLILLLETANKI
jgi:hypothetical protein